MLRVNVLFKGNSFQIIRHNGLKPNHYKNNERH